MHEKGATGAMELTMLRAIAIATQVREEVPVGALVLDDLGNEIAAAGNRVVQDDDPMGHAEMIAMKMALHRLSSRSLLGATLVVTLEPCPMCAYAAREVGISQLIFGLANNKTGACGSVFDIARDSRFGPPLEVTSGVLASECQALLRAFFEPRRETR